ncbi:HAD-IC family P-type ATPase [Patescibacteria group bacterium]|nr:HAD-IC family P-type ATPase [Patescibacteria group bacterium]MBU1563796.1 HAD-IC family P-type ATPase [Patescibacteria group bacterium]
MQRAWHSFSIKETFKDLRTGFKGLSQEKANLRLKRSGLNKLPQEKSLSRLKLFLGQLKSPLIYILIIAGIVTLILTEYTDSIVIFGAVFLNTIVGYLQESKANQALSKLKKFLQVKALVLRNGREKEISQINVVSGDIIFLKAGHKVPADARVIESHGLKVNESILTGEWLPAEKHINVLDKKIPLADRDNMVYMGTLIESGWGKAVITGTGLETEIGKIAQSIRETEEKSTPYQKKVAHLSKIVGLIVAFVSFFIFIEGILTGQDVVEMFKTAIAVAVAAIPEGLPVAMTVILAIGMERILRRKGLVRKLASAETLGNTSIILTDKTGTLTEAKMEVAGIYTGGEILRKVKNGKEDHLLALKIATICNESFIENLEEPTKKWIVRGLPTERALFLAGIQAGLSKEKLIERYPLIDQLFFDSSYQYAASLHKLDSEKNILYMVGSPERILERSSFIHFDNQEKNLLLADLKKIKVKQESLTKQGLRVLAVAYQETNKKEINREIKEEEKKMVFVGFFALHDPIRKETNQAIKLCRQAGMKPIIVTGDHSLTARAVAEQLGFKIKKENILEGKDLTTLSDQQLDKRLKDIQIYARVEPKQKLRIVQAWQRQGEVVAMTGDGINDAPALRQADIGVALGSGTDVAKEVSNLVLLTDNFSVIVAAVEEGRAIIDNTRKVITYLLSGSFSEVVLIGVSLLFGWPLPVLAVQILWVNLIEDGLPDIALAFEPKEKDLMEQKPQDSQVSLLNKEMKFLIFIIGLITSVFLIILFYWLLKFSGYELVHIRSVVFAALTIDSLFYVFSCKSLKRNIWHINLLSNKYLVGAWLFGVVMLLTAIYLAPLQTLLKTVPLNLFDWSLVLGLGVLNILLIEITKYYFIAKHEV